MSVERVEQDLVRGFLHQPEHTDGTAIALAHGAGSNANAPLLVQLCRRFAESGIAALRIDLPFRQQRPSGPPFPATAARDREGLRQASAFLRGRGFEHVVLGGHSYGGRQATMLAAGQPDAADRLLLLSYPLHPPGKPAELRTAHLPSLRIPCIFVHGDRDPFGTIDEIQAALALIPASVRLLVAARSGHELKKGPWEDVAKAVIEPLAPRLPG